MTPPEPRPSRLPIIGQDDTQPGINQNCVLVSRTGQPVYDSCRYCRLPLSGCLQFKGQVSTVALLTVLMLVTIAPLPRSVSYVLGGAAVVVLFFFLRDIGRASQTSILAQFHLRDQQRRLERNARVYQATSTLIHSGPERALLSMVEGMAREGMESTHVLLLQGDSSGLRVIFASDGVSTRVQDFYRSFAQERQGEASALDAHLLLPGAPGSLGETEDEPLSRTSAIVLPLAFQGDALGALVLMRSPNFTEVDLNPAKLLASQVAARMRTEGLHDQVLRSERLSAVGQLAAGVAHEINNPLTYILANQSFVSDYLRAQQSATDEAGGRDDELEDMLEALGDAKAGTERVQAIVAELSAFSRDRSMAEHGPFAVVPAVEAAMKMASTHVEKRARLAQQFEGTPTIIGNPGRLTQTVLNLLMNAAQAIPAGQRDQNEVRVRVYSSPEDDVVIDVEDTGSGIPEAVLGRLFDPFVTTKQDSKGSGLGLAISHGIVTQMGGRLSAEAREERGTRFRLVFPHASDDPARAAISTAGALTPVLPATRKRVLVVDDEEKIRKVVERTLGAHSDVTAAGDGHAALELLAAQEFDVILCDLVMPELTGMQLYARVQERFPEKIDGFVFMTGGVMTDEASEFALERESGGSRVLRKPFDADTLVQMLEDAEAERGSCGGA